MLLNFLHQSKEEKIARYLKRGNGFYIQRKFAKAVPFYQKILQLDSQHYAAILNLAVCYFEEQKYKQSIPLFEEALQMNSQNAWTYNYLSQAYQKEDNFKAALEAAWKAVDLDSANDDHHLNLAYTVYETAEEKGKDFVDLVLKKWHQKTPQNPIMKQCYSSFFYDENFIRSEPQYVEKLFNVFADGFEDILTNLKYDSPKIIADFLHQVFPVEKIKRCRILDLGCGTGLCGKSLKKIYKKSEMIGVDISAQMLAQCASKNIYKSLIKKDIESYLDSTLKDQFDLVVMGDVLAYFGDVKKIIKGVQKVLQKKGVFAFTFSENFENNKSWFLMPSSRFVHSLKYIEKTLISSNFEMLKMSPEILRMEGEKAVRGYIILAIKK